MKEMRSVNVDKKTIVAIVLLLALAVYAKYWLGSRADISDIGKRFDEVRSDIQSTADKQQRTTAEIRESRKLADSIRHTNQSAIREIEGSRAIGTDSASLINEGQSILRAIRARNKN